MSQFKFTLLLAKHIMQKDNLVPQLDTTGHTCKRLSNIDHCNLQTFYFSHELSQQELQIGLSDIIVKMDCGVISDDPQFW